MGTIPTQGNVVWLFKVPACGYAVRYRFYILMVYKVIGIKYDVIKFA